ncbi:cache domain-containing sensor histidine kinase [Paenibacillus mendelii]|uniref:Sensor histidine kinase n=1 Tax=Paenibacillus mendelii TaxID=206163 RepID=A0ABV6J7Z0_9BACL|nr:sensor histidine kinase [Paenibacillus mendelii]MCQ6561349.1 sensor histidine kinase [Paenibacillus mendelii]
MLERTLSYAQTINRHTSDTIDVQLKRLDQDTIQFFHNREVVRFLSGKDSEYNRLRAIMDTLTGFLISHSDVESVFLIKRNGQQINSSNIILANKDKVEFVSEAATGNGKSVWLKTRVSAQGNRVIPLVRQINDLTTIEPLGTLVLFIKENKINRLMEGQDLKIDGELVVLDPKGYIISSRNSHDIGHPYRSDIFEQLKLPTGQFFSKETEKHFYHYLQSDLTSWIYLYRFPESELLSGTHIVRNWVLICSLIFTLLAILLARVIASNLSKPIIQIVKEMRNIESNELNVNLDYAGNDELAVLASSFNNMLSRLRTSIENQAQLQTMGHELEMRALQAEINPHFLYNTLEAINWMGRMNRIPEICDMTSMLADIMRYSIDTQREMVTLGDEIIHVHKYLGIQKIRFGDKLNVFIDIPEHLLGLTIPRLSLQPLVENSIIHGFRDKVGEGKIRVICEERDNKVFIKIEDNGCGMKEETITSVFNGEDLGPKKSIGVMNVHKRLKLFFGEIYGLEIYSVLEKGTRITVKLPGRLEANVQSTHR